MGFAVSWKSIFPKNEFFYTAGAPQPGSIDELSVLPDPLELHTGAMVTISAKLTLTERDKCFVVTGALPLPGRGEDGDSDRLY